ncbi:MAG: SpoIIE family protein phosphatase [Pseudohongiellaceae bacterium]
MRTGLIEWATKARTMEGETHCGDRYVVEPVSNGNGVLVAVIDGVGHGVEAAKASELAVSAISGNPDHSLSALLQRCHNELRGTRGAVISVVYLDGNRTLTWAGVGNVEGRLLRKQIRYRGSSESLLLRTGVLGSERERQPDYFSRGLAVMNGDVLVLATDGIRNDFESDLDIALTPEQIAEKIIQGHRRPNDDALVFVGKISG